ncbi:MAG: DUF4390 domain-containing protein [Wohlfahrtiimonas sp.]
MSFAEDFSISSVYVKNGNKQDIYKVAIEATIKMSDEQVEILENGISLTFSYTFAVEEKVGLVWLEGENDQKTYNYTVSYNALTQQYVVHAHRNKKYENFPTLTLALAYIAEPKNMIIEIVNRQSNRVYRGGVRLKLDINELPTPLRVPAYLSREWNLDTGWKYWEFAPW